MQMFRRMHAIVSPDNTVNIASVCDKSCKVTAIVVTVETVFLKHCTSKYGLADNLWINPVVFLCIFRLLNCHAHSLTGVPCLDNGIIHVIVIRHSPVPFIAKVKGISVLCSMSLSVTVFNANASWLYCS